MWCRPVISILMFLIAMILPLPLRAQQESVGPSGAGPRPNPPIRMADRGDPYVACAAAMPALPPLAARHPEPANAKKPIDQIQVFALLTERVPSHRVAVLVQERGVDFEPTNDYLLQVTLAGGDNELIGALKSARVTKPERVDPALQAHQAEVEQHAAEGAALAREGEYEEAKWVIARIVYGGLCWRGNAQCDELSGACLRARLKDEG
jgi:hypothetical protein